MMDSLETLLKEGTQILKEAEIGEAGLDAWLLLEYTAGINRAYYFAHKEDTADEQVAETYRELIRKRATHIPLQHLTHEANFMGYDFYVNEHVLIPRQDTECLVEEALLALKGTENPRILDMCTGSGCILLSLLMEMKDAEGTGVDLSPDALKVAKRNAKTLGAELRATFVESNLFSNEYFCKRDGKTPEEYDILISNPPYIPTADIEELMEEVRFYDPRMALDGFEDGLYFYREITARAQEFLRPGGWLMYEIGFNQGEDVQKILEKEGFINTKVKQDLCGLDRVVLGQKQ